jgi:tetratricopeptide (TPR) repeat protein
VCLAVFANLKKNITVYCFAPCKDCLYLHFMKILLTAFLCFTGIAVFSQSEPALLKQGDSLFQLKKYTDAIQAYTKVITKNPKQEKAKINRGFGYFLLNKMDLASTDFKEAIKINPACGECYSRLGEISLLKKDTAAALAYANKSIAAQPNYFGAYILKAQISNNRGNKQEAETFYTKAITLADSLPEPYYFRGDFFGHHAEYDNAVKDFSKAIALNPKFEIAYFRRGLIAASNQKWKEALDDFLLAAKYDSTNSDYFNAVAGVYLYIPDLENAHRYYSRALQLENNLFDAWYYRASASYRMEDMDGSCADLQQFVNRVAANTTDPQLKEMREIAIGDMSNYCDSSAPGYFYQRGIANYNLGKYDKSLAWYHRGLAKFPQHSMMTSFRGNAYLISGDYKNAEADYTRALELRGNLVGELQKTRTGLTGDAAAFKSYANTLISEFYRSRAEARLDMNNYAGAVVDIDEAIASSPPDAQGKETLFKTKADIFLAQGDNSNAFSWYNKAIQAAPNYAQALAGRALVKLNLAYRIRVIQPMVGVNNSRVNLPAKTQQVVNRDNLESALADCNKAIAANPKFGYAYYVRSMIKEALDQPDFCYDLMKAEQLGIDYVKAIIAEKKCR